MNTKMFCLFYLLCLVLTAGCQRVPEPDPESFGGASIASTVLLPVPSMSTDGGQGFLRPPFTSTESLSTRYRPLVLCPGRRQPKEEVDGEALKLARDSGVKVIPLVFPFQRKQPCVEGG